MYTKFLKGNFKGSVQYGRSRRRGEDNIKTGLTEIRLERLDCVHPAQDWDQWRLV